MPKHLGIWQYQPASHRDQSQRPASRGVHDALQSAHVYAVGASGVSVSLYLTMECRSPRPYSLGALSEFMFDGVSPI